MQGPYLRKYGVQTTIDFVLFGIDGVDLKVDAAHAAGDTKVMKNEGDEANTTNGFTDEGQGYSIVLTATEMEAARIVVYLVDTATKVWLDTAFCVETYGHASAMHAVDLDDGVRAGLTALPNAAADAAGGLPISDAGDLALDAILADTNSLNDTKIPNTISLANINAEVDTALGDYDAPTKAELDSGLAALNDLSAAQVNAEADTALADYDGPTKAEMDTGHGLLATEAKQDAIDTIVDAIVIDTDTTIPGLIAALNNLSAAEVNTQVATALTAIGLDHLLSAAVAGADVTDNSIIAKMVSKLATADWDSFVNTTDALEAIRDNQAGGDAAAIADAVWDEIKSGHVGAGSFGQEVQLHALSSEVSALNDISTAEVSTEVAAALVAIGLDHLLSAAVAGGDVTDNSVIAKMVSKAATADWDTFSNLTDALEALSDSIAGGGADVAVIAAAVWDKLRADHTDVGSFGEGAASVQGAVTGAVGSVTGAVGSLAAQAKLDVNVEADTALADYNGPTFAEMVAAFAALNDVSLAQITTEISDALGVDTIPELSQAQPAKEPTIKTALMFPYMALRNLRETTAAWDRIFNDAGTMIAKAALSDDGVTVKREKFVSGS